MQSIVSVFKYILESNIINFGIMIWLFYVVCKKLDVASMLHKSVDAVEDYIEKSKREKENSDNLVNESKKLINKLPSEISEIEKFTKQKAEVFRNQLEANTNKTIEKVNNNIDKIIQIEQKKVSNKITDYSFRKSLEKAKVDIVKMLEEKPELHDKFIDESLGELEKV